MNFELCAKHIQPTFILDIGANNGYWSLEAKKIWPTAVFLLIEGNHQCQPYLSKLDFSYVIAVLSDQVKYVDFYTLKDCDTATGASYYRENTPFFEGDKAAPNKIATVTLDSLVDVISARDALIKLDTQGSELDILKGGECTLAQCQSAIIEVSHTEYNIGAPTDKEVYHFMWSHGFGRSEVVGTIVHPITREHIQSDVLFMR